MQVYLLLNGEDNNCFGEKSILMDTNLMEVTVVKPSNEEGDKNGVRRTILMDINLMEVTAANHIIDGST